MTITATPIAHEDKSLRVLTSSFGVTLTVADDPDTDKRWCLECGAPTVPVVQVTILNDEEWVAAPGAESICPSCFESDLVMDEEDAEAELRERALDAEAEYRHDRERERGW